MEDIVRQPVRRGTDPSRVRRIVAAYLAGLVAVVVLLAIVPVPKTSTFAFGDAAYSTSPYGPSPFPFSFNDSWPRALCPTGARAVVQFTSEAWNGTFELIAPNGTPLWTLHSPPATIRFVVPACGTYDFEVVDAGISAHPFYNANVTLSYSAPIL